MFSRRRIQRGLCSLKNILCFNHFSSSNEYECFLLSKDDDHNQLPVPKGFFPVYVGEDRHRYNVPLEYLSFPSFEALLKQSVEDDYFDPRIDGPITIPCTTKTFEEVLKFIREKQEEKDEEEEGTDRHSGHNGLIVCHNPTPVHPRSHSSSSSSSCTMVCCTETTSFHYI
uniref:Uncharacterized protein n=1 Tax=Nelumbo nucifera TaxID=4432 RepID=A0A822Y3E6_NELNU|nr:TPA_asm: hypothetical protein HUJ06_027277 [Nelumbo nucifera]